MEGWVLGVIIAGAVILIAVVITAVLFVGWLRSLFRRNG